MHTLAAKFGAFALAPFFLFGGFGSHGNTNTSYTHYQNRPIMSQNQPDATTTLSIASVTGPSSLAVNASGTWDVNVKSSGDANLSYSVVWGDEGMATPSLMAETAVRSTSSLTHTYASAGTYHPAFTVTDSNGNTATKSTTVTVTDQTALTLASVSSNSGVIGSTVTATGTGFDSGSTVTVGGVAATNVVLNDDGTLSFDVPSLATGTYNVRVHNGDTRSNAVSFTVTAASPVISISGVDAPVTLKVGANGTWTVHAATTASNLHYSVTWGDETASPLMLRAAAVSVNTTGTFTHAYQKAGTFDPKFTISDDNGHSESVSASVVVTK